jgi:type VI secretion system secreted protein Hcp
MFLKIDGVDGELQHKGEIEVLSFSWGVKQNLAPGGGGATGKATISDFSVVKALDSSSPQLMKMCCTGEHVPWATLRVTNRRRGGGSSQQEYLTIKLNDILISSYQTGGDNGTVPGESLTFAFQSIDLETAGGKQASCHVPGTPQ